MSDTIKVSRQGLAMAQEHVDRLQMERSVLQKDHARLTRELGQCKNDLAGMEARVVERDAVIADQMAEIARLRHEVEVVRLAALIKKTMERDE